MPTLELVVNGEVAASAGGSECCSLFVEIGGGRVGPISFLAHGSALPNGSHVVWLDTQLGDESTVKINYLEDGPVIQPISLLKSVVPISARRRDLSMSLSIGDSYVCTARILDREFIAFLLEWHGPDNSFFAQIISASSCEDGYKDKYLWWSGKLFLGDSATISIAS